ncbi:sugar ABC transporter permease [Paenibacillus sp. FSL E2-8871]|jgi:cellobiose transport system permease protein|uniref:Cytochrome C biogenesis protein n=2 Tax=Paenibacillus TaxID=44249 RepID=A0A0W1B3A9_9BACL|nr:MULTISPECIES: sugar ABC transporter permease [Paenibacillus]AIQ23564.1 cytochrome C biogenesis protein [Paenibacillus sp. FSL H7-0737]KAA1191244.1 sugar ABC transporter permease [Paenibacillus sp. B2(2019)]KTD88021.1 cytochrome C biogenesis protein [Paenibacillus etheri]CAH1055623.1 Lactose transport system permease protein LacF [Paenibacillus pseudetheri]
MAEPVISSPHAESKRPFLTEQRRSRITAYTFISPFFILFSIFGLYPIFFTIYLSFFKWDALNPMKFVGMKNYELVTSDPTFWISFSNTLIMGLLGTVPQILLALLIAVLLNSGMTRFKKTFRVLFFMPNITSIVAVTLVFSTLFGNNGMINWMLSGLGLDSVAFNSGWWGVKIAISTMVMWRWTGYNAIIFLSGLQSIPTDLYEAARIDGANRRQQLTFITLPLLKPFIVFVTLLSTIGALQLFTEPYVFLGQSGTGSTRQEGITMVTYLYSEAFRNGFFGTAAATAVLLFVVTIIFSVLNMLVSSRMGGDTGGGKA